MKSLAFSIALFLLALNSHAQTIDRFVSLNDSLQDADFKLAKSHAFQYIVEKGQTLHDASVVQGNFDFTGFVPINGSSRSGYLSINHEFYPIGGVDILRVELDTVYQSWRFVDSWKVDFSVVNGTANNCSGAVTPWGHVVTCEERQTEDINGDGYRDTGWCIEIDPETHAVVDYPGGLVGGDKIWSMGNFRHENMVVHPNLRTVYEAEDDGTGNIYKFVADQEMDFSSGKLYVYVGSKSGSGNWVKLHNDTPYQQNRTVAQADSVGATNFAGCEDIDVSPLDSTVYVSVKGEDCVYRFHDDDPLGGGTVSNFGVFVGQMNYDVETDNGTETVSWGTGNDNLTFDDLGNLWVLQDGSHNNVWVVAPDHTQAEPKVRIFCRAPAGAEPTGMTFTPDFRYMFMSIQHPSGSNSSSVQDDAFQDPRSFDKDVALAIARKEFLGNCHKELILDYTPVQAGLYASAERTEAKAALPSVLHFQLQSGGQVLLEPGFATGSGGVFKADISPCSPKKVP
ncbi:PhoX family protein [Marinilongibacter aquaticus]|uniref:PhoX family protein n=1 Tax=Marinilongibacter aquaticus TaxID=2975157 RepID=UPI0021BDB2AC|nr:PhoX family protein [Marinilongibacter aquaticus]UBM60549.1 PhoX family protein [Marinilongibacter aquaticus]